MGDYSATRGAGLLVWVLWTVMESKSDDFRCQEDISGFSIGQVVCPPSKGSKALRGGRDG